MANTVEIILNAIDKTKAAFKEAEKNSESLFDSLKRNWKMYTAIGASIYGVEKSLGSFISAAKEAQAIENQLRYALEGVGYSWEGLKGRVDEFAGSLQKTTRFADDQARQALTDLMMYTEDFSKAQQGARLAMDMSVRTGQDLFTSTRLIGMAMTGNVEMLGRYIPQLRNLDAVLGPTATMAEKAAYVMKILNEKFGGTAQADIRTYAGQLQQFKNAFDDLKKSLGKGLLPPLTQILAYLTDIVNKMRELKEEAGSLFKWTGPGGRKPADLASRYLLPQTKAVFRVEEGLAEPMKQDRFADEAERARKLAEALRENQIALAKLVAEAERLSELGTMPDWREWLEYTPKRALPDIIELELNLNKLIADADRLSEFGGMDDWREWIEYTPRRALPDLIQLDLELNKIIADAELLSAEGRMPSWLDALEQGVGVMRDDWRKMADEIESTARAMESIGKEISGIWSSHIGAMLKGTETFAEGIKGIFKDMAEYAIEQITRMAMNWALFGNMTGKSGGASFFGTSAGGYGGLIGGILSLFRLKEGGYLPGQFIPIHQFASGGYVKRPTLGMIGEGGEGEYIIPESKMRGGETIVNYTVMNIEATDVDSFERKYGPAVTRINRSSARRGADARKTMKAYW
jgi:hypothetical protein